MGEVHYMISEAAKRVSVESHVLRYWEEELELTIGRTEMGHRYYTEENIQLFNCIKELKEQGMLLRDLKNLIPDMLQAKQALRLKKLEKAVNTPETSIAEETVAVIEKIEKQLQNTDLQEALLANNKLLEEAISLAVSKAVIAEMEILLHSKELLEEERYRKLDSLIRQQQTFRKESANSTTLGKLRKILQLQGA